jgi:hypothetical protein
MNRQNRRAWTLASTSLLVAMAGCYQPSTTELRSDLERAQADLRKARDQLA